MGPQSSLALSLLSLSLLVRTEDGPREGTQQEGISVQPEKELSAGARFAGTLILGFLAVSLGC